MKVSNTKNHFFYGPQAPEGGHPRDCWAVEITPSGLVKISQFGNKGEELFDLSRCYMASEGKLAVVHI